MTALTNKQRVQVNAALAIIHSSGNNASAVTAKAKAYQGQGHSAQKGYELALSEFIGTQPGLAKEITKTIALVAASDEKTIGQYDHALTQYIQTGSDAGLQELAPMIARDSVALAIRNGEITADDVANGGLETALGYAPSQTMIDAAMSPVDAPAAGPFAPRQSFAFKPSAEAPAAAHERSMVNGTQTGPFGPQGYTAPKTGLALAREIGVPMAFAPSQ